MGNIVSRQGYTYTHARTRVHDTLSATPGTNSTVTHLYKKYKTFSRIGTACELLAVSKKQADGRRDANTKRCERFWIDILSCLLETNNNNSLLIIIMWCNEYLIQIWNIQISSILDAINFN